MRAALLIVGALVACGGSSSPESDAPTWHADVAPVLRQKCGACHNSGGLAPFSVDEYGLAAPLAGAIVDAVESGRMPPWGAVASDDCSPVGPFQNDPTLTAEERQLLRDWAAAGAPEGDQSTAAELPDRPSTTLDDADVVLPLEIPFTVDGTRDIYRCFVIDPGTVEDLFVTGVQVVPDNDKVVHHVLVWSDPFGLSDAKVGPDGSYPCDGTPGIYPSSLMAVWVPGAPPMITPPNSAIRFDAGTKLVVNMHYYPTRQGPEVDQTSVALKFTRNRPAQWAEWYLVDIPFGADVLPGENDRGSQPEFFIPAGAESHRESVSLYLPESVLPFDIPIWGLSPHMHVMGQEIKVSIEHAEGGETCLVHVPAYDFNWQQLYQFDMPNADLPAAGPGDRLRVDCRYNNSTSNAALVDMLAANGLDEPYDVTWGEGTGEEMCMGITGILIPSLIDLY